MQGNLLELSQVRQQVRGSVELLGGPDRHPDDTEEVSGKRSVHPGNERALIQGKPTGPCAFDDRKNPQANNQICARICARDMAGRSETGETRRLNTDAR
jgi:hypothetical protein